MKPLTLEETRLKEEMKSHCLAKGQYVDENAKKKFDMLCHLENFEAQYWELQQENKQLKDNWNKLKEYIKETKLKEFEKSYGKRYRKTFTQAEVVVCNMILDKMQKIEQGSDSNENRGNNKVMEQI